MSTPTIRTFWLTYDAIPEDKEYGGLWEVRFDDGTLADVSCGASRSILEVASSKFGWDAAEKAEFRRVR